MAAPDLTTCSATFENSRDSRVFGFVWIGVLPIASLL